MDGKQETEPLTDDDLAAIERRADITDSVEYVCDESTMSDLRRLLAEVDRLRAENARLHKQVQDYHESADAHVAKFDRQHERLMEAKERITAARKVLFDDAFEGHAQRYRAVAQALGDPDE